MTSLSRGEHKLSVQAVRADGSVFVLPSRAHAVGP